MSNTTSSVHVQIQSPLAPGPPLTSRQYARMRDPRPRAHNYNTPSSTTSAPQPQHHEPHGLGAKARATYVHATVAERPFTAQPHVPNHAPSNQRAFFCRFGWSRARYGTALASRVGWVARWVGWDCTDGLIDRYRGRGVLAGAGAGGMGHGIEGW